MTKIDLDDLERMARAVDGARPKTQRIGQYVKAMDEAPVTLALIAYIRELQAFVAAVPEAALQADKVYREDFPGLFAGTGDTCKAMYMDAARAKLLERGAVLP